MMQIRSIRKTDAESYLELCHMLDRETSLMLLEPGERTSSVELQEADIENLYEMRNSQILVAETDSRLVGYVSATGGTFRRNSHKVHLVIGVLQAFSGQGLGMTLLNKIERWACRNRLHRLELTVMAHNKRAISLYRKAGFSIEGVIKDSLYVANQHVDELLMAKIIGK